VNPLSLVLELIATKPIAIFVWWFSTRANTIEFPERAELLRRIDRALAEGRPVLIASNHVSWFDDPVIPMALYRTGPRAVLEFAGLAALIAVCRALPATILPHPFGLAVSIAAAAAIARFGARKDWWTLGDLVNLSDASVLRGKLALTRGAPPGRLQRAALRIADPTIRHFMRSRAVKTILVDRRAGEDSKRTRARAVAETLEIAERLEPIWLFFEGGRSKRIGEIAPARHGVGSLVLGLRERGHRPLVIALYHRGMELLIPPGAPRFLSYGHRVAVRWSEFDVDKSEAAGSDDPQAIADAVRAEVVRLQAAEREGREPHA
jgi:1-acyl-sn-glycerol-3-phosphate acyltransferase